MNLGSVFILHQCQKALLVTINKTITSSDNRGREEKRREEFAIWFVFDKKKIESLPFS